MENRKGKYGEKLLKCEKCDGNLRVENQLGKPGNFGEITINWRNQGCNAGEQSRNLSIAVEIVWKSNGNDKLKDSRECKTINLVSNISVGDFFDNFFIFTTVSFCFCY